MCTRLSSIFTPKSFLEQTLGQGEFDRKERRQKVVDVFTTINLYLLFIPNKQNLQRKEKGVSLKEGWESLESRRNSFGYE